MRLPYSWLREVVAAGAPGWDVPAEDLEQALIRIGHEVEDIIPVGPVSGPLTVGRVAEIEELTEFKKPIRAVKVDVGEPQPRDIVCGATNFAVGDLVVAAHPLLERGAPAGVEWPVVADADHHAGGADAALGWCGPGLGLQGRHHR